jgi:hypothetical protein
MWCAMGGKRVMITGRSRSLGRGGFLERGAIAIGALVAVGGSLLVPGVAAAEPLRAECVRPDPAGVVTCTYTEAGVHALTVPAGVQAVQVTAIGGRGGATEVFGSVVEGGRGALVSGVAAVPSGTRTLYAVVAGDGADTKYGYIAGGAGGSGGGGTGGVSSRVGRPVPGWPGAGGGGASDVRTDAVEVTSRVLVAAGGGGAAFAGAGGDAGAPGTVDGLESGIPAQPGTDAAGGAGGFYYFPNTTAGAGSLGRGGNGAPETPTSDSHDVGGGGGGGGLYGGGGGSVYGSGGGGSSLIPAEGTVSLTDSTPSVTITYLPVAVPTDPSCTGSSCLPPGDVR